MSAPHIPSDVQTSGMNPGEAAFFAKHYTSTPTTQESAPAEGDAKPAESGEGTGDEPAGGKETTPTEGQEEQKQASPETTTQGPPEGSDRDQQLKYWMDKYAKDLNLDPETQHKALRMLAEKELEVQRQRAAAQAAKDPTAHLTEFEKSLLTGKTDTQTTQPKEATQPAETKATTDPPRPPTDQIGSNWRSFDDAQKEYGEAWSKGDMKRAGEIQNALFWLQLSEALPTLNKLIDERLQGRVGDVLPDVTEMAWQAKAKRAQDMALADLAGVSGFEGIRDDLFKKDEGFVEFNGERWDNTPLNRIIKEHPEILDIHVEHEDPEKAARATFTRRFRLAKAFLDQQKSSPATTAKVLQAGIEAGKKEVANGFRQRLNQGSGAGAGPAQGASYIEEMRSKSGFGKNLSSI